jgi:hypothetical protein
VSSALGFVLAVPSLVPRVPSRPAETCSWVRARICLLSTPRLAPTSDRARIGSVPAPSVPSATCSLERR